MNEINDNKNPQEIEVEKTPDAEIHEHELMDLRDRLERAEQLLIREHNRRIFEKAAGVAGIRSDRIDAAWKLAGIESSAEAINEESASEMAGKIVANYPEFSHRRKPLVTDQDVPMDGRKSRAAASGDALVLLKALRRK